VRVLVLVFALAVSVSAQGPDVASRSAGAGRVVVARVFSVHAQLETNRYGDRLIVSHAVLEVLETLKGAPVAFLDVSVEGGTVGGLTLKVSDLPSLAEGDRAVFFLDADGPGHVPHGRGLGIVKRDAAGTYGGLSLEAVRAGVGR
jgi:hypothetical protein